MQTTRAAAKPSAVQPGTSAPLLHRDGVSVIPNSRYNLQKAKRRMQCIIDIFVKQLYGHICQITQRPLDSLPPFRDKKQNLIQFFLVEI